MRFDTFYVVAKVQRGTNKTYVSSLPKQDTQPPYIPKASVMRETLAITHRSNKVVEAVSNGITPYSREGTPLETAQKPKKKNKIDTQMIQR